MTNGVIRKTVTIKDPMGLHPRPATAFAQLASRYESRVTVWYGDKPANGKNAWELIMLVALPGAELTVEIDGPDAPEACESLCECLATPMYEDA